VLDEMLIAFYPPVYASTTDELLEQCVVLLRRYVKALGRYERDTLDSAWDSVIASHKGQGWPTIQEFVTECDFYKPDDGWRKDTVQAWDRVGGPSKAMPDYSYQVELGILSQAEADRLTEQHGSPATEYRQPTPEDIARVEAITRQAKQYLAMPHTVVLGKEAA
jgi:hypothetical protein